MSTSRLAESYFCPPAKPGVVFGTTNAKIPLTLAGKRDSGLDIKVYPNVIPLVNSAFGTEAVQVRFRIFACHKECGKQQVIT